jgi:quercetin dioxygenase-like cupin family protein
MTDAKFERAAEYVLGLLSAEQRAALTRAAAADPALADEIAAWNLRLSPLATTGNVEPPPDMFARIQAAIASQSQPEPTPITIRADEGAWETLGDGVERKMLWGAGPNRRVAFLVRVAPGATIQAHEHADDEECYVVSGDLTFGKLTLRAGDYHLARRGIPHAAASSVSGCLLLVTAAA